MVTDHPILNFRQVWSRPVRVFLPLPETFLETLSQLLDFRICEKHQHPLQLQGSLGQTAAGTSTFSYDWRVRPVIAGQNWRFEPEFTFGRIFRYVDMGWLRTLI